MQLLFQMSSLDPDEVVVAYRESERGFVRIVKSDSVSKFSLDTFQDTGYVVPFFPDIVPEDKNVVTKFLFAGTFYGVEKVFYLNEDDEVYVKDLGYKMVNLPAKGLSLTESPAVMYIQKIPILTESKKLTNKSPNYQSLFKCWPRLLLKIR
eukprot:Trichotokara_eunicae@DN6347_c0_g2_i3.p1